MQWFNWTLLVLGIIVAIDGVGSVLIKGGQYHNQLFDGERYFRAIVGVAIILLGIFIP